MTNKNDAFQDSIDELLLMEKRIERKANELTEYNNKSQERIDEAINNIDLTVNRFEKRVQHKIERLEKLNEIAHSGAATLAEHSKRWMMAFFVFAIIIAIVTGAANWKVNNLVGQIYVAKSMLAELNVKLSKTPEVVKYGEEITLKSLNTQK